MLTKAEFLEQITKINPKYNVEMIGKAFETGVKLHDGQLRKSGEPYFIHPIEVALIFILRFPLFLQDKHTHPHSQSSHHSHQQV